MELSARKRAVLLAIVGAYIRTGEPVGSKALTQLLENAPSSATLRNEMSELCELGYLEQPHTSAGRIPTSSAYRLYIDNLLDSNRLPRERREVIDRMFGGITNDPERIPAHILHMVSGLTGLPALSATVAGENSSIRRAQLLPMGRHTAMLVIITSNGRARSRMCRSPQQITPQSIEVFDRLVRERVAGVAASAVTPAFLQSIIVAAGSDALTLMPMLTALYEMICEVSRSTLEMNGESNIFSVCENEDDARQILSLFEHREALLSMLSKQEDAVSVLFGSEMHFAKRNPSTVIIARYNNGDSDYGRIGVVGPARMSYEQIIPNLAYIAEKTGAIMTRALKDMEE